MDLFKGDWKRADFVLGRDFSSGKGGLLEEVSNNSIYARAGDELDLVDLAEFAYPSWWDPDSPTWDGDKFAAYLTLAAI